MFFFVSSLLKKALLALMLCAATVWANPDHLPQGAPVRLALIEGLSGPFANAGESVWRNLAWGIERINERGGVHWGGAKRELRLERYDNKGQVEESQIGRAHV